MQEMQDSAHQSRHTLRFDQGPRGLWRLGGIALILASGLTAMLAFAALGLALAGGSSRMILLGAVLLIAFACAAGLTGLHLFLYQRSISLDPAHRQAIEEWTWLGRRRQRRYDLSTCSRVDVRRKNLHPGRSSAGGGITTWIVGLHGASGFVTVTEEASRDDGRRTAEHIAAALGLPCGEMGLI